MVIIRSPRENGNALYQILKTFLDVALLEFFLFIWLIRCDNMASQIINPMTLFFQQLIKS